ncbi:7770_t:CDS:2 [Acaulospora colombiana]|uniref:7770_t:CDS:1 n=1 Tax=Acaulospora colombiana TaxID=27376 RepID=A0ACA9LWI6_9GLOM|nr:7770_t:CDS:2 [Acaulospora colombiana]
MPVPQLIPNTSIEMQRYELAEQRRQARLSHFLHEDEYGRREQTRLDEIRKIMRNWSELSNVERKSSAEVPPLLQEPESYEEDNTDDNDPAKLFLNRRKSIIRDSLLVQPDRRLISETFAEVVEVVLPQHANTLQITFGGQIIAWMEQSVRVSASRHSRKFILLASIDSLQFLKPTYVGDVDFNNMPVRVPRVVPDNEEEEVMFSGSELRRKRRLYQRRELVQKELSAHPEEFEQNLQDK